MAALAISIGFMIGESHVQPFSSDGQSGLAMAAVVAAAGLQQPSEGDSWFEFAVRCAAPPKTYEKRLSFMLTLILFEYV